MKKSIIIALIAFLSFTTGNANTLLMQNVPLKPGETVDVDILLSSTASKYIGVQFDLIVPEGFSLENGKDGNVYNLSADQAVDMVCNVQEFENGTRRFILYSNTLLPLKEGRLLSFKLKASSSKPLGDYTIKASEIAFSDANGTVTKESDVNATIKVFNPLSEVVVINANNYTREYGDNNPTFEYTTSGAELVGIPQITCEATAASPVGTYDIVVKKGTVSNENVSYVSGTLTITKAPLKITAESYTINQGEALPNLRITYEGFKNNETEAVLTKKPTISTIATLGSDPNVYDINVSGAEAQNYEISYVKGKLTIMATYILGDADDDGKVDVNDVTSTINYILKKPVATFIFEAADMDKDGKIDVNDVQAIIYKALGKK